MICRGRVPADTDEPQPLPYYPILSIQCISQGKEVTVERTCVLTSDVAETDPATTLRTAPSRDTRKPQRVCAPAIPTFIVA